MRRTRDDWAKIVRRYRASGLSVRRFARQKRIGEQSLRKWIRRFEMPPEGKAALEAGFIEIPAAPRFVLPASRGLTIRFANGCCIEAFPDSDLHFLGVVVGLLQASK